MTHEYIHYKSIEIRIGIQLNCLQGVGELNNEFTFILLNNLYEMDVIES